MPAPSPSSSQRDRSQVARRRRRLVPVAALGAAAVVLVASSAGASATIHLTSIGAQPRTPGLSTPNTLSPQLIETIAAQGSQPLENPSADGVVAYYGYLADGSPFLPTTLVSPTEAQKTEPDKNTYLVLRDQHGADPSYRLRRATSCTRATSSAPRGYITRINLDADPAHRVTLLASTQVATANLPAGNLPVIDGSVWNPFTKTLLFSYEGNGTSTGGIWEATPDYPSTVVDRLGLFGRGGFEGMQEDEDGNIWIVEDLGGKNGTAGAGLPTNSPSSRTASSSGSCPTASTTSVPAASSRSSRSRARTASGHLHRRGQPQPGADRRRRDVGVHA